MPIFLDKSDDFHPYECDGPGKCIHCDRQKIYDDEGNIKHDPEDCELCASIDQSGNWKRMI